MLPRDQTFDEIGRALEQHVFFVADESDVVVPAQRAVQIARLLKCLQRIARAVDFSKPGRATKREQGIVGNAAERRTQDRRQGQLVSLVIEKAQQLDQIGDLVALIKPSTQTV